MALRFVIATRNNADVLARVVLLFHRSAVEIESIHMPARANRKGLRFTITVDGQPRNAERMAPILEKSIDVLGVKVYESAGNARRKEFWGGTIG